MVKCGFRISFSLQPLTPIFRLHDSNCNNNDNRKNKKRNEPQLEQNEHENIDQSTRIDNKILKNYCDRFTWNSKFCKWPKNFTVHFVCLSGRFRFSLKLSTLRLKKRTPKDRGKSFGSHFYRMLSMCVCSKCKYWNEQVAEWERAYRDVQTSQLHVDFLGWDKIG